MNAAHDRGAALAETIRQPGTVWCYEHPDAGPPRLVGELPPADGRFRWLHLNLADQRSLRWLERESGLSPALVALLVATDGQARLVTEADAIGLVLHDFERGLDAVGVGQIDALRVVATPRLLVTARARPLHSADLVRERLAQGTALDDGPAALAFLVATLIDSLAALVLDLTAQLLDAEADLMANDEAPDTRVLISARRRSAQLHRLVGGLRATLRRMDTEPALGPRYAAIAPMQEPRLAALDTDIVSIQQQLRLLRDELDLQAAQRTNHNVYMLSVMTALMMPATLVTGFFGMNTSALPLAGGSHGTLTATLIAILSAAISYWLLRRMGLIRRR